MPTWTPNHIDNPFFALTIEPAHGGRIVALEQTPTAIYNDPAGRWTLVVVDVATGVQGQLQLDMGLQPTSVPQPEPFLIEAIDD